jgi:hypothetical protein
VTALATLTGAPSGLYRDRAGDLWIVSRVAGVECLTWGAEDHDMSRAPADRFDFASRAFGPFVPVDVVERPTPPLPETPGSLVRLDGETYVRIGTWDLADNPQSKAWSPTSAPVLPHKRSDQLAGAEILLDASTLTPSKETPA